VGAMMHKIYRTKSRENILLFLEENKERMLSAVEIYG
jgi:Fe2+ or Zn2+ uptake regulation protein